MRDSAIKALPSFFVMLIGIAVVLIIPSQVKVMNEEGLNSRTLPYIAAYIIVLGSAWNILTTLVAGLRKPKGADIAAPVAPEQAKTGKDTLRSYLRVVLLVVAIVFWALLLKPLGYVIGTLILVTSIMVIAGNRKPLHIAVLAVILTALTYYVFKAVLFVNLPKGLFFF